METKTIRVDVTEQVVARCTVSMIIPAAWDDKTIAAWLSGEDDMEGAGEVPDADSQFCNLERDQMTDFREEVCERDFEREGS